MSEDQQQSQELIVPEREFSAPATQQSRAVFLPANLAEAMKLAEYMAGGIGVRPWMRKNPSACLALIQISMRWGMDPYIVANKSYYANDTLSFESQLVNAVLNTSGQLIGRLKVTFEGDATGGVGKETLVCKVSGRIEADPDQLFEHEQALSTITVRNSPLWKTNPKQQLQYYTTRAWARLYLPEVLLGIYTPDEVADGLAERIAQQSTPRDLTVKAPDRREFRREEPEDAEVEEIETVVAKEPENETVAEEETADLLDDDANGSDDTAGVEASGQEPELPIVEKTKHILDVVPENDEQWGLWKTTVYAAIERLKSRTGFDNLRARISDALGKASEADMSEVQEWLSDKLVTLPEDKK